MHLISCAVVALAIAVSLVAGGPHSEDEPAITCSTTVGNNNYCGDYGNDQDNFLPYDVYYNGTMSFTFATGSSGASPGCVQSNNSESSAWLSIGDMLTPDKKTNRSNWDTNPYYFHLVACAEPSWQYWFNKNASDYKCSGGSGNAGFQSSTSVMYWGQGWTISATKNTDGYDLSGTLTTKKTNKGSDVGFALDGCTALGGRHITYSTDALEAADQVSMTGHISPTNADMTITLKNLTILSTNFGKGQTLTWSFKGTHWNSGATLLTTDSVPQADGQAKLKVTNANASKPSLKMHWWIYAAAAIGGLILIALFIKSCICGSRGFTPKKRNNAQAQPQVYQLPQVNQQTDAYKQPQVYTLSQGYTPQPPGAVYGHGQSQNPDGS